MFFTFKVAFNAEQENQYKELTEKFSNILSTETDPMSIAIAYNKLKTELQEKFTMTINGKQSEKQHVPGGLYTSFNEFQRKIFEDVYNHSHWRFNPNNKYNVTALMFAATCYEDNDLDRVLLETKNVNATDKWGRTALFYPGCVSLMFQYGLCVLDQKLIVEVIEKLLKAGVNPHVKDIYGHDALYYYRQYEFGTHEGIAALERHLSAPTIPLNETPQEESKGGLACYAVMGIGGLLTFSACVGKDFEKLVAGAIVATAGAVGLYNSKSDREGRSSNGRGLGQRL